MDPTDQSHLMVLRAIEADPASSQRELARTLGISLGKTNYCLKALLNKGWIKARNFRESENKLAYRYLLTPKGIENKARLTLAFLERKRKEFEAIKRVIENLTRETQSFEEGGGESR